MTQEQFDEYKQSMFHTIQAWNTELLEARENVRKKDSQIQELEEHIEFSRAALRGSRKPSRQPLSVGSQRELKSPFLKEAYTSGSKLQPYYETLPRKLRRLAVEMILFRAEIAKARKDWLLVEYHSTRAAQLAQLLDNKPLSAYCELYRGIAFIGHGQWARAQDAFDEVDPCIGVYRSANAIAEWRQKLRLEYNPPSRTPYTPSRTPYTLSWNPYTSSRNPYTSLRNQYTSLQNQYTSSRNSYAQSGNQYTPSVMKSSPIDQTLFQGFESLNNVPSWENGGSRLDTQAFFGVPVIPPPLAPALRSRPGGGRNLIYTPPQRIGSNTSSLEFRSPVRGASSSPLTRPAESPSSNKVSPLGSRLGAWPGMPYAPLGSTTGSIGFRSPVRKDTPSQLVRSTKSPVSNKFSPLRNHFDTSQMIPHTPQSVGSIIGSTGFRSPIRRSNSFPLVGSTGSSSYSKTSPMQLNRWSRFRIYSTIEEGSESTTPPLAEPATRRFSLDSVSLMHPSLHHSSGRSSRSKHSSGKDDPKRSNSLPSHFKPGSKASSSYRGSNPSQEILRAAKRLSPISSRSRSSGPDPFPRPHEEPTQHAGPLVSPAYSSRATYPYSPRKRETWAISISDLSPMSPQIPPPDFADDLQEFNISNMVHRSPREKYILSSPSPRPRHAETSITPRTKEGLSRSRPRAAVASNLNSNRWSEHGPPRVGPKGMTASRWSLPSREDLNMRLQRLELQCARLLAGELSPVEKD